MAFEVGTANNYTDLLNKLVDFVSTKLGASDNWTVLRAPTATDSAVFLKAPGSNEESPCYINFYRYERPTSDWYNIGVSGAIGYVDGASMSQQPGALGAMGFPLWNQAIPYWFNATKHRIIVAVRVDTVYMHMYVGKIAAFGSPGQYPYPLIIGAPLPSASETRYSSGVGIPYKGNRGNLKLRTIDGTWISPFVWPYFNQSSGIVECKFRDTNGTYPLLPLTIFGGVDGYGSPNGAANTFGVFDDVFHVSGFGNAVENIITVDAKRYIVLQDGTSNGIKDFVAMRIA